jgi:hypothetical protein
MIDSKSIQLKKIKSLTANLQMYLQDNPVMNFRSKICVKLLGIVIDYLDLIGRHFELWSKENA